MRIIASVLILLGALFTASPSHAWTVSVDQYFFVGIAFSKTFASSSPTEFILIDEIRVDTALFEEGSLADDDSKSCDRPYILNVPQTLSCSETAYDLSLTPSCLYCAQGIAFAFTPIGTLYETKTAPEECHIYFGGGNW